MADGLREKLEQIAQTEREKASKAKRAAEVAYWQILARAQAPEEGDVERLEELRRELQIERSDTLTHMDLLDRYRDTYALYCQTSELQNRSADAYSKRDDLREELKRETARLEAAVKTAERTAWVASCRHAEAAEAPTADARVAVLKAGASAEAMTAAETILCPQAVAAAKEALAKPFTDDARFPSMAEMAFQQKIRNLPDRAKEPPREPHIVRETAGGRLVP